MAPVKGEQFTSFNPPWGFAEQINTATPGATAQHAKILVVLAALHASLGPVNLVSDSHYVVKVVNSIETARLKGDPNSTIFQLFTQGQLVIQACTSPFLYLYAFTHRPTWPYE
jgi:hypothetical protein